MRILLLAALLSCAASPAVAFFQGPWNENAQRGTIGGYAKASASRACLTGPTRGVLAGLERRYGTVKVISTCRPGAVIAGSGRPSQHRYGKAVDFMPNGNRAAMLAWLRANAGGAVITYASGHIHFDTGGYRNRIAGAKYKHYSARKKWRRR